MDSSGAYSPPSEPGIHITTLKALLAASDRPMVPARGQPGLFRNDAGRSMPLYCAGDRSLVARRSVAIVGTRDPSRMGIARARRLARELARAGIVVASGLARGVDTEALTAAIDAGGRVIAVIGTPLGKAYPAENRRLQERIYREHLLLSQFAPGHQVAQSNFPVRNRLMAALTDATAIIEAGERSGTLHQASACVRLERWLFIARSAVDDPSLEWPAGFMDKPRVRVLNATHDVLEVLTLPRR